MAARNRRLKIFVSYAREDADLVKNIVSELTVPFGVVLLDFFVDTESIKAGDDWRKTINERLEQADILLIVATNLLKESYDFPGYEAGFFARSIMERPTAGGIARRIIPLILGRQPPAPVFDIQGVMIRQEDVFGIEVAPGESEANFLQGVKNNNPFRELLTYLRDIVTTMTDTKLSDAELQRMNKAINYSSIQLYKEVFSYLRTRVCEDLFPERKIIIRTPAPQPSGNEGILAASTVEFVGKSFEVFGLAERPVQRKWTEFLSDISRLEIATQWNEGIRTLVAGALESRKGVPDDNYYFLSSLRGDQSFRLFVSLNRTYFSGDREIHIYIVALAPLKDYGDRKTTKLLKAVALGLRYRSLFLEEGSPFSPDLLGYWHGKDLRARIAELWNDLQHMLTEARQERLDDPELLSLIYGAGGHRRLDELVVVWHDAETELSKKTRDVVAASDDKVDAMKSDFLDVLTKFCSQTEQMNREYTTKALQALEGEITRKLAEPLGNGARPVVSVAARLQ